MIDHDTDQRVFPWPVADDHRTGTPGLYRRRRGPADGKQRHVIRHGIERKIALHRAGAEKGYSGMVPVNLLRSEQRPVYNQLMYRQTCLFQQIRQLIPPLVPAEKVDPLPRFSPAFITTCPLPAPSPNPPSPQWHPTQNAPPPVAAWPRSYKRSSSPALLLAHPRSSTPLPPLPHSCW